MAWSAPVLLTAVSAPAFAASPPRGCATLLWTNTTLSGAQGTNGVRTATLQYGSSRVTVRVAQSRTAGLAANANQDGDTTAAPTPSSGDFSVAAAGQQKASGTIRLAWQNNGYTVNTSTTSSVLTLNQKSSSTALASQTVTFSFTDANGVAIRPASLAFNLYDVTQVSSGTATQCYTDLVTWGGASAGYGTPQGSPNTYSPLNASRIQGTNASTNDGGGYIRVSLTPSATAPSLTYSNVTAAGNRTVNNNRQYIGIGDLQVCF